jgi:hypothetical protein
MKAKAAVFFGAVVLAFLVAACSNPAVEAPRGATGQIVVSIGVEGEESLEPAESLNAAARGGGPLARTVVPSGFSTSSFDKFEATFTATNGGTSAGPTVLNPGPNAISLDVGTYKVTITGYTGSDSNYVAVAEGAEENVVVTLGGSTTATVLVGLKTGGGVGSFSYDITVTPAIDSGALTVTTTSGEPVSGGIVTLNGGGTKTDGTISGLAAGYYQALVSVTKGTEYAGFVEIIHIYPGLTSVLPAWTFTADHFAPAAAVSIFDLNGTFAAPVTGAAPDTSFNAQQYTGAIAWSPSVSGTFVASTPYTATVTLTAKPGYTFDGLAQDAFSYNGTVPTNNAGSGVVEIVFDATEAVAGGLANTTYAVDDGVIAVTVDPSNKTIQKGEDTKLVLTVPGDYTVTGWYIDGVKAEPLGTGLSVSLDPANYSASTHTVSVFATKGGVPYSWRDTFIVEAAAGGGDSGGEPLGPFNLAEFIAATQNMETNTPDTPLTLILDASVNINNNCEDIYEALKPAVMENKYIVVDLRQNNQRSYSMEFAVAFTTTSVVGVIFPEDVTNINAPFSGVGGREAPGLRSVTIPATVTSIGQNAFYYCSALVKVVFMGNNIATMESRRFEDSFISFYNNQSIKAGIYTKSGDDWSWTPLP